MELFFKKEEEFVVEKSYINILAKSSFLKLIFFTNVFQGFSSQLLQQ